MSDLAELHAMYCDNITPAMTEVLAEQLGVPWTVLRQLGVGYHITDSAWVFPERDGEGKIIGLVRRFWNGDKYSMKNSKRGLTYAAEAAIDGYNASRQQWGRASAKRPCPICGGQKWCGFDDNHSPEQFVRCMRQREGSVYTDRGGGHIHELVFGSFKSPSVHTSPLAASGKPTLVVEGQTDCAVALDLGYVAVGRPSAKGGFKYLADLLRGRRVAVIGENDAGVGREGMEETFQALKGVCRGIVKVMPPEEFKDLREWAQRGGLTTEELDEEIKTGSSDSAGNLLESRAPLYIAELWLRKEQYKDGVPRLRKYKGEWYRWNGTCYQQLDEDAELRGPLYRFLQDKQVRAVTATKTAVMDYEATRAKVNDIVDALSMSCPVQEDPPCWLDRRKGGPDPCDTISFANGVLDVDTHLHGDTLLLHPTPLLFNTSFVDYAFNTEAVCPQWITFLGQIFHEDPDRIALLQEWMGYNMVADSSMEKFMLMVGRPGSGKGTVLEVMQAVIGRDQCAKTSFADLCSPFGLQSLVGCLAIILPDAHVPRQVDAVQALERIKTVTGRDSVSVGRKYLPNLANVHLPGRFTVAVNELPELPDHARSLERRLLLLHFPETFEGREDRTLKDRLPKEAPGIAVWALKGLQRLREREEFTTPPSSQVVMNEFRRFLTPIAEFMHECCEMSDNENCFVYRSQVYDAWAAWAKEHGLRPGVRSRFGQRLLAQDATIEVGRMRVDGGIRVGVYRGIMLTSEAKRRYLGGT